MDISLSALLGRLSGTLPDVAEPETFDSLQRSTFTRQQIYQDAMYRCAVIMHDAYHGILRVRSIDTVTAEGYLQKLNIWSASLPPELRKFTQATPLVQPSQAALLGKVHVAGLYYWTVMLITRPFLFFMMTCRSKQGSSSVPYEPQAFAKITTLSEVCVSAAIYFAQMCQRALEPDSLLNNMCILRSVFNAKAGSQQITSLLIVIAGAGCTAPGWCLDSLWSPLTTSVTTWKMHLRELAKFSRSCQARVHDLNTTTMCLAALPMPSQSIDRNVPPNQGFCIQVSSLNCLPSTQEPEIGRGSGTRPWILYTITAPIYAAHRPLPPRAWVVDYSHPKFQRAP